MRQIWFTLIITNQIVWANVPEFSERCVAHQEPAVGRGIFDHVAKLSLPFPGSSGAWKARDFVYATVKIHKNRWLYA